jgi:hypothetical protein
MLLALSIVAVNRILDPSRSKEAAEEVFVALSARKDCPSWHIALMYARLTAHRNNIAVSIMHGLYNLITNHTQYTEVCLASSFCFISIRD